MSEKQTPLTAEEIDTSTLEGFLLRAAVDSMSTDAAFKIFSEKEIINGLLRRGILKKWAKPEQTTAQLRQELEQVKIKLSDEVIRCNGLSESLKEENKISKAITDNSALVNEVCKNQNHKLEQVKAQRDVLSTLLRSYVDYFTGTLTPDFEKDALEILSSLEK